MEFSVFRLPKWGNIIQEVYIQLETHLPQSVANYLKSDLRNRGVSNKFTAKSEKQRTK